MSALCVCACVCRYRYQLEALIDKLRGRDPEHWFDAQDSIANMEWIEAIYKEVGRHLCPSPFNSFLYPWGIEDLRQWLTDVVFLSQTGLGSRPPSTAEVPQATGT
jgi:hypothetical protein